MKRGIVYIATGEEFIDEAIKSAINTRENTELPIALISNREVNNDVFSEVIIDEDPKDSFEDKPRNLMKTPFDKTLYLDTDVYILEEVPELFEILDHYNLATSIDPNEWELRCDPEEAFEEIPESFPLFQTGVMAYNANEKVSSFIKKWQSLHSDNDVKRDQSSFRAALYKYDIDHTSLSNLYNCLIGWPMQVTGEVKIVHDSDHIDHIDDLKPIVDRMNRTDEPRVFFTPRGSLHAPLWPRGNKVLRTFSVIAKCSYALKQLIKRTVGALDEKGVRYTLNEAVKKIRK